MFDFLRRSGLRSPSAALRGALEAEGLPPGTDVSALGVVESRGTFAGRKVTYFRVFDPRLAAGRAVDVFSRFTYQDLGAHLDLVLRTGHVERDGRIVLSPLPHATVMAAPGPSPDGHVPAREPADRADHVDDERVVFPGEGR